MSIMHDLGPYIHSFQEDCLRFGDNVVLNCFVILILLDALSCNTFFCLKHLPSPQVSLLRLTRITLTGREWDFSIEYF